MSDDISRELFYYWISNNLIDEATALRIADENGWLIKTDEHANHHD